MIKAFTMMLGEWFILHESLERSLLLLLVLYNPAKIGTEISREKPKEGKYFYPYSSKKKLVFIPGLPVLMISLGREYGWM